MGNIQKVMDPIALAVANSVWSEASVRAVARRNCAVVNDSHELPKNERESFISMARWEALMYYVGPVVTPQILKS